MSAINTSMSTTIATISAASISADSLLDFQIVTSFNSLISDDEAVIIIWILDAIVCQAIDLFGIVTNCVNIACFIKQGFQDPVNVSLFGLAIADLGCLTTLMSINVFLTPAFSSADLPFSSAEFMYVTSGLSHVTFTRISMWITAVIIFERCLCITAPLKVKSIITSKRMTIIIACSFIFLMSSMAPVYVVNRLGAKYFPELNKTLIGIVYSENYEQVERISYIVNNVLIPFVSFMAIIISTIILVYKLQEVTKWREAATSAVHSDSVSNRNKRVALMVVMISCLFLACFIPVSLLFIAMSVLPELSVAGRLKNVVVTAGGVAVIFESVNSSSNIFIYYHMSSKYRAAFHQLLPSRKKLQVNLM